MMQGPSTALQPQHICVAQRFSLQPVTYTGEGVPCLGLLRQVLHAHRLILHIAGITWGSRPTLVVTGLQEMRARGTDGNANEQ
jgi:hypothetical protein